MSTIMCTEQKTYTGKINMENRLYMVFTHDLSYKKIIYKQESNVRLNYGQLHYQLICRRDIQWKARLLLKGLVGRKWFRNLGTVPGITAVNS